VPRRKKSKTPPAPVHLLDTNVILRYLIGDNPPLAARALALMERAEQGKESVIISEEVLTETVWTLESFYKVPRTEIAERLTALLSVDGVQAFSAEILARALQLYSTTRADFVDCMLAARGQDGDIPVYTFDETDFKKLSVTWQSP
jgi:predicted nucleic-acid-binding protein